MGTILRVAILVVAVGLAGGCELPEARTSSKGKEESKLVSWLENLKEFDVKSCEYTLEKSSDSKFGRMPSSADTRMELTGFAELSPEGLAKLKADFDWTPAGRETVPPALRPLLPEGDILVSPKLNESFEKNRSFTHGFVALPADDNSKRVYFLTTDKDHPIEME